MVLNIDKRAVNAKPESKMRHELLNFTFLTVLLLTYSKHGFHFDHRQVLVCVLQFLLILFKDNIRVISFVFEHQFGANQV